MYGESVKRLLAGTDMMVAMPPSCVDSVIHLSGEGSLGKAHFDLDNAELLTGTQCCGSTGSGKTYFGKKFINQLRSNIGEPYALVIVQAKDDFNELHRSRDLVICQGNDSDKSVRWNLFNDILAEGYNMEMIKLNTRQFVKHIFDYKKDSKEHFFVDAAEELLYCVIISYIKEGVTSLKARQKMTNKGLLDFFLEYSEYKYNCLINNCGEPGVLKLILGENLNNKQALGVLGELVTTVLQVFVDVFAEEGDFSIRQFIRNKENKALFINYDPSYKDTQVKIFGSIIDFMLKECLAQDSTDGKVIIICDELVTIGKTDIANAVNLGRAKGLIVLCGFQSVEQLESIYGEHDAQSLMAGLRTKLFFAPNDAKTRVYMQECFGKGLIENMILSPGGCRCERREGYILEDVDINNMITGECYVRKPNGASFKFKFD